MREKNEGRSDKEGRDIGGNMRGGVTGEEDCEGMNENGETANRRRDNSTAGEKISDRNVYTEVKTEGRRGHQRTRYQLNTSQVQL